MTKEDLTPSIVIMRGDGHMCCTCGDILKRKQNIFILNLIDGTGPHTLCLSCIRSLRRDIDALKILIETGIDTK